MAFFPPWKSVNGYFCTIVYYTIITLPLKPILIRLIFGKGRYSHARYHNQYAMLMAMGTTEGLLAAIPGKRILCFPVLDSPVFNGMLPTGWAITSPAGIISG